MNRIFPSDVLAKCSNMDGITYSRGMSEDGVAVRGGTETRGGRKRAWTMRNSAARQMPSRHCQGAARLSTDGCEDEVLLEIRAREAATAAAETCADVIVHEMEQDPQLMQDNPQAEEMRKEALRELPQCLTMKRTVRAKISASVSLKSKRKPIPLRRRIKYRISFAIKRLRERSKDFFFSIELWYEAIRTIEGHFGSAVGSYFYFLRSLFIINALLSVFVVSFVVIPQILHDQSVVGNVPSEASVYSGGILDLLSGQGMFEDTVMFYGHYITGSVADSSYDMTFAYFFTMVVLYLFLFGVLSVRTAWSYRKHFIDTESDLRHVYATKVFCGWDFGIATRTAAANNSRSIYNELKELLSEQNKSTEHRTSCATVCRLVANLTVNVLVLAVIGGVLALFWWILEHNTGEGIGYWPLAMAAIVTTVLTVAPKLFSRIVRLENYDARTSLYVTLARSFVLDAGTLLLLLVYWFRREEVCWETMLGQELYRLIVLDILFSVAVSLLQYVRGIVYMKLFPTHPLELDLAYDCLRLVYEQSLLWLGLMFSPVLCCVVCANMAVSFYVRRVVVMRACRPARKLWRAAQTQTALSVLVSLSLLGAVCVIGFAVMRSSSKQCGPFQRYDKVYMVLTEGVLELSQRRTLRSLLVFATRPGVVGLLLVFLCAGVSYARSRAAAHRSMVGVLREMLALEAKDKDFLLAAIAKVCDGEWLYSPKRQASKADDSHTWRYLNDDNVRKPSNCGFHFARAEPAPHVAPAGPSDRRRGSCFNVDRPELNRRSNDDGDTDSSFSWRGSTGKLNDEQSPVLRAPN